MSNIKFPQNCVCAVAIPEITAVAKNHVSQVYRSQLCIAVQ